MDTPFRSPPFLWNPPHLRLPAVASPQPPLPPNYIVVVYGTFDGHLQADVKERVRAVGAKCVSKITPVTSVLVTSHRSFDNRGRQIRAALGWEVPVVGLAWLEKVERERATVPTVFFELGPRFRKTWPSSGPAVPRNAGVRFPRAAKGKVTYQIPDDDDDDDDDDDGGGGDTHHVEGEEETERMPVRTVKRTENETGVDNATDQVASGPRLVVPVDEHSNLTECSLFVNPKDGAVYDAYLSLSNVDRNSNRFYKLQVLHVEAANKYYLFTRQGRVGAAGTCSVKGDSSLASAVRGFTLKFHHRTGLRWSQRDRDPRPGKYSFMQQNYEEAGDEQQQQPQLKKPKREVAGWRPTPFDKITGAAAFESKLAEPVQDLMCMIFNLAFFRNTMEELNYDSGKLPLGMLSRNAILKGYSLLKEIAGIIDVMGFSPGDPRKTKLVGLNNQYFACIPHNVGRKRLPLLQTMRQIHSEMELLDNLTNMKEAADLMGRMRQRQPNATGLHPLDHHFQGLGLAEMTALDPSSLEYRRLSMYFEHGMYQSATAHVIVHIFRIERKGEHARFDGFEGLRAPGAVGSQRRLLWHGSRCTNFGGILSRGLCIAPPEAPANGYMFGKGIYLADVSRKSMGYCKSGNEGLLLLCEVEVGDRMKQRYTADSTMESEIKQSEYVAVNGLGRMFPPQWGDAGWVHPSLRGILMPHTTYPIAGRTDSSCMLLHNEYIVYDVAQVRLRYLLRVAL